MATIYKHGEIGQIERVAYKLCFCADGKILRNDGDGWKLWRTLKPGVDPREHYEKAKANYAAKLQEKPAFAEWRTLFHNTFAFCHRYMALTVISSMPQDPDGVWSELNDYLNISIGVEEVVEVCRAYEAAERESQPQEETKTVQVELTQVS